MLERPPYNGPWLPWIGVGAIATPIMYFFSKLILGAILSILLPKGFITVPDWLFWVLGGGGAAAMCVYVSHKGI